MSGTLQTQFHYKELTVLDAAGNSAPTVFGADFGANGFGRSLYMAPSGRMWWSFDALLVHFDQFPYMIAGGE